MYITNAVKITGVLFGPLLTRLANQLPTVDQRIQERIVPSWLQSIHKDLMAWPDAKRFIKVVLPDNIPFAVVHSINLAFGLPLPLKIIILFISIIPTANLSDRFRGYLGDKLPGKIAALVAPSDFFHPIPKRNFLEWIERNNHQWCNMVDSQNPSLNNHRCPITGKTLNEPLLAPDGRHYEKRAIHSWLEEAGPVSPITGERLIIKDLQLDQELFSNIQKILKLDLIEESLINGKNLTKEIEKLEMSELTDIKERITKRMERLETPELSRAKKTVSNRIEELQEIILDELYGETPKRKYRKSTG